MYLLNSKLFFQYFITFACDCSFKLAFCVLEPIKVLFYKEKNKIEAETLPGVTEKVAVDRTNETFMYSVQAYHV